MIISLETLKLYEMYLQRLKSIPINHDLPWQDFLAERVLIDITLDRVGHMIHQLLDLQ